MKILFLLFIVAANCINGHSQEIRFKTSDSVDLYVKIAGKGIPCLYIHGGPGSGSYWAEKFAGDILERNMQMIYVDQRGVGRSGSPAKMDFSPERMLRDFEELRSYLKISKWLTMGHSFGGILQMQYALQYPGAVAGMLFINCTLNINEAKPAILKAYEFLNEPEMKKYLNDSIPIGEQMGRFYGRLREKGLFWKMGYAVKESEDMMNKSFQEIPDWNHDYESKAIEIKDNWVNFKPFTKNLKMPVLFFYGLTDWMVGPEHYKGVQFPEMILWGSQTGHVPFIENKPDLDKAVTTYLDKYHFHLADK